MIDISQLEQFLVDASLQARNDAKNGRGPDISSILDETPDLKEISPEAVQETILALRKMAATKEGAKRIVSIITLAVRYGAKLI